MLYILYSCVKESTSRQLLGTFRWRWFSLTCRQEVDRPCSNVTPVGVGEDGEVETAAELETKAGTEWGKGDFFETSLRVCSTTDVLVRNNYDMHVSRKKLDRYDWYDIT